MALTTPSQSPAVSIREIDLTGVVSNVQSSTGAFVGEFSWGPVDKRVSVSNESELVSTFGSPEKAKAVDFFSAAYFLKYSSSLFVVRVEDGTNASSGTPATIKNTDHWETSFSATADTFYAKYPGELGNSIEVTVIPAGVENDLFDSVPEGDELHVIVKDVDGKISGFAGEVLETFAYVSSVSGSKDAQGGSSYISDVINSQSQYVWVGEVELGFSPDSGETVWSYTLSGGTTSTVSTANKGAAYSIFEDVDSVTVDFIIAAQDVDADVVTTISEIRRDCVAVASPSRSSVIGNPDPTATILTNAPLTRSSYTVIDNNFFKVYDKYNDQYIFIPAASSTAGLMAATDLQSAPWFSPAGERRGRYLGVTDLAYSPSKADRDELYKAGINPIANIPGSGVLLYGDKTYQRRPSAFDRINVRRLFLTLERAIGEAGKNVMFEMNDEFTRAEFVNIVEPLLREVQGRRGITDFRVVCDETNNTPAVIDRNEFVASIFIKPARSINYVTLNFVAVRTGVQFEEVVGLV
jgi:phage tail sheath protein FI